MAEVAGQVEAAGRPFAVVDADGRPIGKLTREAVIAVLVGRESR